MIRSFSYAAWSGAFTRLARRPEDLSRVEPWALLWERATAAAFLRAYRETTDGQPFVPAGDQAWRILLDAYVLDKVLYELAYELDNRPGWIRVPLTGILAFDRLAR